MPRIARIVAVGVPHHVTQRGNNRQAIFFSDDDRRVYLEILRTQSKRYGAKILGYCLMPNHVHHVVLPERPESLAKTFGRTHWLYAQYVNTRHERSGHLFQNRFFSTPMDVDHTPHAMRYTETNPVRAKLCKTARAYPWSSAAAHCTGEDPFNVLDLAGWRELFDEADGWANVLKDDLEESDLKAIRRALQTGRPLAGEGFVSKLEKKIGRKISQTSPGRPRGSKKAPTPKSPERP